MGLSGRLRGMLLKISALHAFVFLPEVYMMRFINACIREKERRWMFADISDQIFM